MFLSPNNDLYFCMKYNTDYDEDRISPGDERDKSLRKQLYVFLEARTLWGRRFESFIMLVIFVTVTQVLMLVCSALFECQFRCPLEGILCSLCPACIFHLWFWVSAPDKSPFNETLLGSRSQLSEYLDIFLKYSDTLKKTHLDKTTGSVSRVMYVTSTIISNIVMDKDRFNKDGK